MSLTSRVLSGGYVKGQKSSTDKKGYRNFIVYTLVGDEKNPLYRDNDEVLKEMKIFRGKSPKEVAKKVVTEICQMIKKSDPTDYKKYCRAVTVSEISKREKDVMKLESVAIKDPRQADQMVNWTLYPGFRFELQDAMNTTSDGNPRNYIYYGERIKLDQPKKYKGKKFSYESQVIPIRKDYTLVQALIDHHYKSQKATKRYNQTKNFEKHRRSKSKSKTKSKKSSKRRSKSKSKSSRSRKNSKSTTKNKILNLTTAEITRKCSPGHKSFKVPELNKILTNLDLSTSGTKPTKCQRLLDYYNNN